MRTRNKGISLIFAVAVLLTFTAGFVKYRGKNSAPVIWIESSDEFVYKGQTETEELCQGVRAYDKEDGDISRDIMVEQIVLLQGGNEAKITYAVKDSKNKVVKIERTVACNLQQKDDNKQSQGEIEKTNPEVNEGEPVEPTPLVTVTPEPTQEVLPPGSPVIKLNTYTEHLHVGDSFNFLSYIESLTDDNDAYIYENIQLEGEYDTSKPGTYTVLFYAVDKDNNKSNVEKLTLIVE